MVVMIVGGDGWLFVVMVGAVRPEVKGRGVLVVVVAEEKSRGRKQCTCAVVWWWW